MGEVKGSIYKILVADMGWKPFGEVVFVGPMGAHKQPAQTMIGEVIVTTMIKPKGLGYTVGLSFKKNGRELVLSSRKDIPGVPENVSVLTEVFNYAQECALRVIPANILMGVAE